MAQGSKGVGKVLSKLKKSIEEHKYYEAHQMYRTLYFRYCGQGKFTEVLELLYDGSSLLLSHDQHMSGADLALLYLEVLEKSKAKPTEDNICRISHIFKLMNESVERQEYLVRAVKWSTNEIFEQGHPNLHQSLAQILWKEKNYESARYHYLRSEDGCGCGRMLIELHLTEGYASEADLFLAQAVLQYLCLKKKIVATQVFETFTTRHPNILEDHGPPYLLPLLNFIWLLFSAIDNGTVIQFTILCELYKPSLCRDPTYKSYLDRIGQVFFDIPPPTTQPRRGFLGNLLQGLFDAGNDIDEGSSSSQPMPTEDLD